MPFRGITGHQPLLELLARAIARGTLPPSLIFAGPAGVGKRMTATALAQALNCERRVDYPDASVLDAGPVGKEACGVCASCKRIARGVHADILVIEPGDSGSIKVDQVREAIDRAAYRPFEGKRRLVVVDEADAMIPEAQNALLKTLEEPPPSSVFVLITSRPDVLLPTVRSRCQRLRFGPLAPADVAAVLMRDHAIDAAAAHAAAAASDGSIGRALESSGDDVNESDPRRRLDGARALVAGGADRDGLSRRLLALASLIRDLGLLHSRADERALANADLKPRLQGLLRSYDGDRTLRAFATVDRALWALDRNASPKIVADWLALNI